MIALDTNVVVRALTADDPAQYEIAAALLRSGPVAVTKTVLLETEWVLRGAYDLERESINDGLRRLIGLENLTVEDRSRVVKALDWHTAGMDFADALHLASSTGSSEFASFDASLAKTARRLGSKPSVRLLSART